MSESSPVASLLAALAPVLARQGLPWYVFGAQAAMCWGRPRLTADVDITVQVAEGEVARLLGELTHAGFRLRVPDADEIVRRARGLAEESSSTSRGAWPWPPR